MTAFLSPVAGAASQFFTNLGVVLAGGKIQTYIAGSTTPQATWTDSGQTVQNANPVILDSAGRVPNEIWLANGVAYKFVIMDSNSNNLGTYDNISGINVSNASFSEWIISGYVVTYVSTTSFTVPGDQTATLQVNRRVQYTLNSGTFYGYISAVVYDGVTLTTVTIVPDATNLDNTLSVVNYSFMNALNVSIPQQYIIASADKVPSRTGKTDNILTTLDGIVSSWATSLKATVIRFVDGSDITKKLAFGLSGISTGTTRTITIPNVDTTLVGTDATQTLTNKTLTDSTTFFADDGDATKKAQFQLSGISTGTTRTFTFPNSSGTLVVTPAGSVLLAVLTPTASANVDFLSTFSPTYDNYLIIGDGIKPSSDDILRVRVAVSGTADAGSNYYEGAAYSTAAVTATSTSLSTTSTVTSAGIGACFEIRIKNANDATNVKIITNESGFQTNATPGYANRFTVSSYSAANAISGVRFYWNGASNFAVTGKILVFGFSNT